MTAKNGFAVAAINAFGHGYGADGRLVIRERSGAVTELPLGGRAVDYNGKGAFGAPAAAVLNVVGGTGWDISRCQNPDGAYVLRHQPVKFIEDRAALEIQEWRDRHNWIEMRCDPAAYAPHYVASTLPGVSIRPVLFQVAKGDLSLPNPASSNLIRAARLEAARCEPLGAAHFRAGSV